MCSVFGEKVFDNIPSNAHVSLSFCPYNSQPYLRYDNSNEKVHVVLTDERRNRWKTEPKTYVDHYKSVMSSRTDPQKLLMYNAIEKGIHYKGKSFTDVAVYDHLFTRPSLLHMIFRLVNLIVPGTLVKPRNGYDVEFMKYAFKSENRRGVYVLRALQQYNSKPGTRGNKEKFVDWIQEKHRRDTHINIIVTEANKLTYDPLEMTIDDWKVVWGDADKDWYKVGESDEDFLTYIDMGNIDMKVAEENEYYKDLRLNTEESSRALEYLTKLWSNLIVPKSTNDILNYIAAAGKGAPRHNRSANGLGHVSREIHDTYDTHMRPYVEAIIAFYEAEKNDVRKEIATKFFNPFDHIYHDAERDDHFVCFMNDDLARALGRKQPKKSVVWLVDPTLLNDEQRNPVSAAQYIANESTIIRKSILSTHTNILLVEAPPNHTGREPHYTERDTYVHWFIYHIQQYQRGIVKNETE